MGFREITEPLSKMGVPTTPVRPNSKQAFLPDFPNTATTDLAQIIKWDEQFPNHNGAALARAAPWRGIVRLDRWFHALDPAP